MSSIAFLNIAVHGHVNPTLPVVAELVRRGHRVSYHTSAPFSAEIAATGATVRLDPGTDLRLPDPPTPPTLLNGLAEATLRVLPALLVDLRRHRPELIVHDSSCPWGAIAARELGILAASSFTSFAFNRHVPSPVRSIDALRSAARRPTEVLRYLAKRLSLRRRFDTGGLPLVEIFNIRQPLNLVYTSRAFHPAADTFGESFKFVGPSLGARPADTSFPFQRLRAPVIYASLGTVFNADPRVLRGLVDALAPLGGTVVVSTGQTDPEGLGPLPPNVIARPFVPQPELLAHAALFVTHGGMNSVNEALHAGVPMVVLPQGADQPLVARRVVDLRAGLTVAPADATVETVRAHARRVLDDPGFRRAATTLRAAQREAGGYRRAADELEGYLRRVARPLPSGVGDPSLPH